MVSGITLTLNLLILIFTVVKPMKLHLIEIIFLWMVVTFIHLNFYYIVAFNLNYWKHVKQEDLFWLLVITRITAIPLLVIWFISLYWRYPLQFYRIALAILFASLLVGIDYLMDYAKIVNFVTWSIWKSYATWFVILVISLLISRWYRTFLRKEMLLDSIPAQKL